MGFFVLIPLVVIAVLYGTRAGLVAGLLSHPVNQVLLYLIMGDPLNADDVLPGKLVAWAGAFLVAVTLGHLSEQHRKQQRLSARLEQANAELQRALDTVKTLTGLLPICANCKKIRNEEDYWQQVEEYTDASFTHGICPDCMDELYPKV